jgi:hypothetical protein
MGAFKCTGGFNHFGSRRIDFVLAPGTALFLLPGRRSVWLLLTTGYWPAQTVKHPNDASLLLLLPRRRRPQCAVGVGAECCRACTFPGDRGVMGVVLVADWYTGRPGHN